MRPEPDEADEVTCFDRMTNEEIGAKRREENRLSKLFKFTNAHLDIIKKLVRMTVDDMLEVALSSIITRLTAIETAMKDDKFAQKVVDIEQNNKIKALAKADVTQKESKAELAKLIGWGVTVVIAAACAYAALK